MPAISYGTFLGGKSDAFKQKPCSAHKKPLLELVGTSAVLLGQPMITKSFRLKGASYGASVASTVARKLLKGQFFSKAHWAPTINQFFKKSTKLSTVIGRLIPVVGWALLFVNAGFKKHHQVRHHQDSLF